MSDHHGIPSIPGVDDLDLIEGILEKLGVTEHTDEDCLVSEMLHRSSGKPVVASGRTVFVGDDQQWTRYRISASDRRRLLAKHPGEVTLKPPSDGG